MAGSRKMHRNGYSALWKYLMTPRMASNSKISVGNWAHSKGIGYAIAKRLLIGTLVLGLDIKSADHQLFECRHCEHH